MEPAFRLVFATLLGDHPVTWSSSMADPNSDDEDPPQLSAHALAALQEFYVEQQAGGNPDESTKVAENWVMNVICD